MRFMIETLSDAQKLLAYYGRFHDAITSSVKITSRDCFAAEKPQDSSESCDPYHLVTGVFDVEILFIALLSHGEDDGIAVKGRFEGVTHLCIDYCIPDQFFSTWSPSEVRIEESARSQDSGSGNWLCFSVLVSVYTSEKVWRPKESIRFRFERAEFVQVCRSYRQDNEG